MTPYPGDCAECGKPLNSYDIRYGWVTVQTGTRGYSSARVHSICRHKFENRPFEERLIRTQAQWEGVSR